MNCRTQTAEPTAGASQNLFEENLPTSGSTIGTPIL